MYCMIAVEMMDFSCTEVHCSPRATLSDGTCESDVRTMSKKVYEYKVYYSRRYPILYRKQIGTAWQI